MIREKSPRTTVGAPSKASTLLLLNWGAMNVMLRPSRKPKSHGLPSRKSSAFKGMLSW